MLQDVFCFNRYEEGKYGAIYRASCRASMCNTYLMIVLMDTYILQHSYVLRTQTQSKSTSTAYRCLCCRVLTIHMAGTLQQ